MISECSDLYRAHPDWVLRAPFRPTQIGRNQYVLDLSRHDVIDYIFESLSALLDSCNIVYMKWDMNRPLSEVFSLRERDESSFAAGRFDVWQAETAHRYTLGVYEILHRLIERYPYLLLESCCSGGGRFDLGMLYYSPQIWTSDNTDCLTRMKIQYGSSLIFPAKCMGSHVSVSPNHITGNYSRARTRGFMAMCGTFGFELDVTLATNKELAIFQEQALLYRLIAPIIREGVLYRLWNPFKMRFSSHMYISRDQSLAVVFAFTNNNSDHWSNVVPRLVLRGLNAEAEYEVTEPMPNNLAQKSGNLQIIETELPCFQLRYSTVVLPGMHLMSAGLPIKFYSLDDSVLFLLRKVK